MKKLAIISFIVLVSTSLFAVKPLLDVSKPWKAVKEVEKDFKKNKFPKRQFVITNYGAKQGVEDYKTNAINAAINAAAAMGGGTVIVPKGVWYTGPITLKTNINLHLEDSAVLKFSTNPDDYKPFVLTRFEGWDCINFRPLIYAYGEDNVAVTGKGILDGQANETNWWPWKGKKNYGWKEGMISQEWNGTKENGGRNRLAKMEKNNVPMEKRVMTIEDRLRPSFVELNNCTNILLQDFTLINSPFWCLHPLLSKNVIVRGVTVKSHGPNNDGCDPESCEVVLIEKCTFDTGDDCIAIKSGKNNDGRRWARPSKNIIVRNCIMKDGHGGVVLGSEISGNVKNVWVEDCEMDSPNLDRVIRIKSNPIRGGKLENFFIRNIKVGQCDEAVFRIEMKYEKVTEGPNMPLVKNFIMENITSEKSRYGIWIDGFENAPQKQVTGVTLRNCKFNNVKTPYKIVGAENVVFDNVVINGETVQYK
ncbi:MAG: glycoside hydrolase family 28 protein [Paludibacteraceae bacterium]|nr:glycoside hydrolase family 28 protein [Paludibacteraceae bacterium]MBN2786986.1 glycoside hydrolase family 28 protein [Paludibacteraceae bacterium]